MVTKQNIEAVILANGDYPVGKIPSDVLHNAKYVVCCDGAADKYLENGFIPNAIVGDGDSLSEAQRRCHSDILHCFREQESNDLTKAVRFLLGQGKRHIAIVGATGKREDHTLGNISLLIEYARAGATVRMYTEYGVFIPCNGCCHINSFVGQQVSIFNFTGSGFSSQGLRYPIYDFVSWWQGTLNECTGSMFDIECKGEYILFLKYPTEG